MSKRSDNRSNPLAALGNPFERAVRPSVMPYKSCMHCGRGDSTRVVSVHGDGHWLAEFYHLKVGIPVEEALVLGEMDGGSVDRSTAIGSERHSYYVRFCRKCVEDLDLRAYSETRLEGGEPGWMWGYVQPHDR